MDKVDTYIARAPKKPLPMTPDILGLLHRRTEPFLRNSSHLSLSQIVKEAYLQGMRDVLDAQGKLP